MEIRWGRRWLVVLLLIVGLGHLVGPSSFSWAQADELWRELMGYWRLDEGTGTLAYDETAFRNDGRVHQASWVVGLVEFGLNYYAERQALVEVPDDESLDLREALTLACWICLDEALVKVADLNVFPLFLKSVWGTATDEQASALAEIEGVYRLDVVRLKGAGVEGLRLRGGLYLDLPGGGVVKNELIGRREVPVGRWVHVAFTYDAITGETRLYLDGELEVKVKLHQGVVATSEGPLFLGVSLPGILDEARVYRRVLSAEEVYQLVKEASIFDPRERPCGNCYAPPAVEALLREWMAASTISQGEFLRWLLVVFNPITGLPLTAPVEAIAAAFLELGIIPEAFPLALDEPITKGLAALLLLRTLGLETPLIDQLLLTVGVDVAAEVAFEIAVEERLLPPGDPEEPLRGIDLAAMTLPVLDRLAISGSGLLSEEWQRSCAQVKRLFLQAAEPPLPPLPPPPVEPPSP